MTNTLHRIITSLPWSDLRCTYEVDYPLSYLLLGFIMNLVSLRAGQHGETPPYSTSHQLVGLWFILAFSKLSNSKRIRLIYAFPSERWFTSSKMTIRCCHFIDRSLQI